MGLEKNIVLEISQNYLTLPIIPMNIDFDKLVRGPLKKHQHKIWNPCIILREDVKNVILQSDIYGNTL